MSKQSTNLVSKISKSTKSRGAVRAAAHSAAFEVLEDRRLFSALTINGTGLDDIIRVNQTGSVLTVNVNGASRAYPAMRFTDVVVNALGGNDRVLATPWFAKPLTINAGAGNDYMLGGKANDTFNGGDGSDVMATSRGADEFNGGLGTDLADYSACSAALNITLDDVANDGMIGEGDNVRSDVENVNGGLAGDTITGSSAANYLQGGGGTDTLRGLDGNDILDGGIGGAFPANRNNGNDVLFGGNGDDTLHASDIGDNTLHGEAGNDHAFGYGGDDTLNGGLGNDTLNGGFGVDSVNGNAGDDTCFGGPGADTVDGDSGRDFCYGGTGNDVVYGGSGDDFCDGEAGVDKVYGNSGPQPIVVFPLPVFQQAAPEALLPIDPIIIDPRPLPIDLEPIRPINPYVLPEIDLTPRLPKPDVRLVDVSILDRVVLVETDNDIVHGGADNDRVRGDGGNDQVFGDAGNDFCYGDAGNDVVHGGADEDNLYGGSGDDQLFGDDGDDTLVTIGGGQHDQNTGGNGLDSVWCDAEATELDHNDFLSALVEGLAGTHHRVAGFETVSNGTSSQTPSRELNGQNLLDPKPKGSTTYQTFSDRPLFGANGPHKDDIDQGGLADCYYLAGLSAVAKTNPNRIKQSVVDLGDGTYAVQFFRDGAAEFFRVDNQLPANGAGNPTYQALGHDDSMWAAILEKAFCFRRTGAGPYESIEYGGAAAFDVLNLAHSSVMGATGLATLQNISAALSGGKAVIAGTRGTIPAGVPAVGNHMYSIESVNLSTINIFGTTVDFGSTITVRNPWHTDGAGNSDGANDGYVTMTTSQFFQAFDYARAALA